jgi:hypothetical protein
MLLTPHYKHTRLYDRYYKISKLPCKQAIEQASKHPSSSTIYISLSVSVSPCVCLPAKQACFFIHTTYWKLLAVQLRVSSAAAAGPKKKDKNKKEEEEEEIH